MSVELISVGHSNHADAAFVSLIATQRIEAVADVRSHPFSRFAVHFNRDALAARLKAEGIGYVWLGRELGGRPEGDEYYDDGGHVLYGRVAESARFREGLERLLTGAARMRVAMMCSEEDPLHCHRRLLVARVVEREGKATVRHLRGNGSIQSEADLVTRDSPASLFGDEGALWRSTLSVSHRSPRSASSAF